jgi:hypothetical protein
MNRRLIQVPQVLLVLALAVMAGCDIDGDRVTPGELRNVSRTVPLGAARSAKVSLEMKAGEMKVEGGATNLFEGDFSYNVTNWKPDVTYDVSDGVGNLRVEQPEAGRSAGHTRNEWNVRLNNQTPLDMKVIMGAGQATLNLAGLALRRMELNIGAGEVTVDLSGDWKDDVSAQIHGGVGKATIRLPRAVGVYVVAHGGLGAINANDLQKQNGAYVNDLYGKSPVAVRVEVEGGVGEIDLELGKEAQGA